ncbi:hypothetical protein E2C01_081258 [Portunus trituberculatus]|uniref:Uncharacterized protein n=1 Tax=Portunus trituberculatus TaxID=210409 RepID=A0A5B7ILR8_PORTR|nr:hypothetical protein [Portunus trituberculatus]
MHYNNSKNTIYLHFTSTPPSPPPTGLKGCVRMAACVGVLPPPAQGAPPPTSSLVSDTHRYACKSYANKLLQNLCALWHSQHFCDVEISAGGFVVKVRRGQVGVWVGRKWGEGGECGCGGDGGRRKV